MRPVFCCPRVCKMFRMDHQTNLMGFGAILDQARDWASLRCVRRWPGLHIVCHRVIICSLSTVIHHHSRACVRRIAFRTHRGSDSFYTKRRVGFLAGLARLTPAFFVSGCFFADVAAPPAATQVQRRVRRPHVKFVCFIRVQFRDPPRSTGTALAIRFFSICFEHDAARSHWRPFPAMQSGAVAKLHCPGNTRCPFDGAPEAPREFSGSNTEFFELCLLFKRAFGANTIHRVGSPISPSTTSPSSINPCSSARSARWPSVMRWSGSTSACTATSP